MSSPTPDWTAVVERLEKLERQNRRMKQAGAVALLLATAVLLMGQASPNRTVEANEFVLKDANGRVRGRWSIKADTAQFHLVDTNGVDRISLAELGNSTLLSLQDSDGGQRASLQVIRQTSQLLLNHADDRASVHLAAEESGNTTLTLFGISELNLAGRMRLWSNIDEGETGLSLTDNKGFQTTIGTTDLVTPRTGETHKTSAASVVLFDKDNNVLWKAP